MREELRLQITAALRQMFVGSVVSSGRARAAVAKLVPQLEVPQYATRAEAAMALDALCEHTESAAIDVCEVGGTARLADAMAEVYHNQLTQDIMHAESKSAAFDLRREVGSGNLWIACDHDLDS